MAEFPDDSGSSDAGRDLEQRLAAARQRNDRPGTARTDRGGDDGMGVGLRSGIEFVAALAVSLGIGVALDRWLHSAPVATLIMLVLGFGAGLLNVYRAMQGLTYGATYKNTAGASAPATKDDTDET